MAPGKDLHGLHADLQELSIEWFAGITGRVGWYVASGGFDISQSLPPPCFDGAQETSGMHSIRLNRPFAHNHISFPLGFIQCTASLLSFLHETGQSDQPSQSSQQQQQQQPLPPQDQVYLYVYAMWFFMLHCAGACYEFDCGAWVIGPHKRPLLWIELCTVDRLGLMVEGLPVLHYMVCFPTSQDGNMPPTSSGANISSEQLGTECSTCIEEVCIVLAIATRLVNADHSIRCEVLPQITVAHTIFDQSIFSSLAEIRNESSSESASASTEATKLNATVLLLWLIRISPEVLDLTREEQAGQKNTKPTVQTLLSELLHSPRINRSCYDLISQASSFSSSNNNMFSRHDSDSSSGRATNRSDVTPCILLPDHTASSIHVPCISTSQRTTDAASSAITATSDISPLNAMKSELADLKQMQKTMGSIIVALNEKIHQGKSAK